ncbi:MAG: CHASE3 domain-containing protein [Bdellovibrionales bacterium]|nr:CHASE3 domain-containing protein [Bdellovibrionales bacterium]
MEDLPRIEGAAKKHDKHYSDPRTFKKILLQSTLLPIGLSLILSILFINQVFNILEENQKVRHSDEVLNYAREALKLVLDSETGFRGFIITNNTEYIEPWENARIRFDDSISKITALVKDNQAQVREIKNIKNLYEQWNLKAEETLNYRERYNKNSPPEMIQLRKKIMDDMRAAFDEFIGRENKLRNNRWNESEETSRKAIMFIIALGAFLGFSLATMSLYQLRKLSATYTEAYASLSAATENLETIVTQRTHELVLVNKELEAFSYSVSHDLRAPLRGIDGFSQILVEDYGDKIDDEGKRYLGFIRSGVQKMGLLIDDLINLSRLTRAEFKKESFDLSILGAEIMKELKSQHSDRTVEFINFPPYKVNGDLGLIRAALQNLMSNAWKYSSNQEVIKIELGIKINKEDKEIFFVKDNGVGFDMRFYDKLFQPFQRLHPKDQFDGTGIGLATVARIIRRHGGSIWAESVVGKGSTFYFTIGNYL